jgi:uncharacterized protein
MMKKTVRIKRSWNRDLIGCLFDPGPSSTGRAILFVHGQGSNQRGYEDRAQSASSSLGAACLTFDLSGHGDDSARYRHYSLYDHIQDVVAAYDYLASHEAVDQERVGACGASYGGYLVALLTAHRLVKRLILRAPSLAKDTGFLLPTSGEPPSELDSLRTLAGYPGEVLILESEKDEVIPPSVIKAYLQACRHGKHQLLRGATHALTEPSWNEQFISEIIGWFKDL